ncbi:MAG: peptide deformylase [Pseudomonadales bacterium]|nr:peptide deformylase [Pseudomonadales bacterium]MCP5183394.1 peptide deformylase [Pseudomonadales bacterium]
MAVRRIIRMGHPHLRQPAAAVDPTVLDTPEFARLLDDMYDTLHDYGGIGLAAPQIDVSLRLAIIELPGGPSRYGEIERIPLTVFVNPVLSVVDPAAAGYWEGCLSVPGLRGFVTRPQHVHVRYLDELGNEAEMTLQGFPATVVQHEFDHLDGRLYIDRIDDPTKLVFEDEFDRYVLPALQGSPTV